MVIKYNNIFLYKALLTLPKLGFFGLKTNHLATLGLITILIYSIFLLMFSVFMEYFLNFCNFIIYTLCSQYILFVLKLIWTKSETQSLSEVSSVGLLSVSLLKSDANFFPTVASKGPSVKVLFYISGFPCYPLRTFQSG
jgi:hypothetical protein